VAKINRKCAKIPIGDLLSLFLHKKQDALISFGDGDTVLRRAFENCYDAMGMVTKYAYPSWSERLTEKKIKFALDLKHHLHPQAFELLIGDKELEKGHYERRDTQENSLIENLILLMACSPVFPEELEAWCLILTRAIRAGIDLHYRCRINSTLLSMRFLSYPLTVQWYGKYSELHCPSRTWLLKRYLKCLVSASVDILLFGQKEKEICREESRYLGEHIWRISHNWKADIEDTYEDSRETYFCLCIKYGPTVDDWEVWDDRAANYEYAEDFWHMIESPWERAPGACID
jgi:hypothetical protein